MSASARNPPIGRPSTAAETVDFLRVVGKLGPKDRRRLARFLGVLVAEKEATRRPYTDRLMALKGTTSPHAGFLALLSEFSDN